MSIRIVTFLASISASSTNLGMRVGNDKRPASFSAFLTDLKRIQTPHRLLWDFGAEKIFTTPWSGCRVHWVKFESKVRAPAGPCRDSAGRLAITPEGYCRRKWKVLTAKSMAELLHPRSGTAWAGSLGEHKRRAFPSRLQSLWVTTSSLETKVLLLLQYQLSLTTDFLLYEYSMEFARTCYQRK